MIIQVCYFARIREHLGLNEEHVSMPDGSSIEQVVDFLRLRGEPWSQVLAADQKILTAVNHEMSKGNRVLHNGDELAFFPPVTGG